MPRHHHTPVRATSVASAAITAIALVALTCGCKAVEHPGTPPVTGAVRAAREADGDAHPGTPGPRPAVKIDPAQITDELDPEYTEDGRSYLALAPGDTVSLGDYVEALRAGVAMYRFGDGSAMVVDDVAPLPEAVVADVAAGVGDGLGLSDTRAFDVVSALRSSGVHAYVVRHVYDNGAPAGWIVTATGNDLISPDPDGTTAGPTIWAALAAAQADIAAHPGVVVLGPGGIIAPRISEVAPSIGVRGEEGEGTPCVDAQHRARTVEPCADTSSQRTTVGGTTR